jgi:hypothetical protein
MTEFDDGKQDFNCGTYSSSQSVGNKGLTIWGPKTTAIHLTSGQTSDPLYFTGTKPKCYSNYPSFCNVTYTLHTEVTSSSEVVGPITMTLHSSKGTDSSSRYHSRIQGHDLIETHDISQPPSTTVYNDTSWNYLTFTNNADVAVWIQGLQIVRCYDMNNLATDMQTPCPCQADATEPEHPDFATRYDYPCNYENCGGLSFTTHAPDYHYYDPDDCDTGTILRPNQTYTWSWTNSSAVTHNGFSNYVGSSHCLFNFNNVQLCDDNGNSPSNLQACTDDIAFMLSLDNSHWSTFYHCKNNLSMAHSIDLATHPYLSQYYNDAPDGSNTLYLRIINNPGVNLFLVDGGIGLLNLYQVYQTASLCQTITVSQSSGGTISPGTTTVKQGESKTFTITPNQGYQVTHVWTDGIDRGAISSYTFSEVVSPHTISATFQTQYYTLSVYSDDGGSAYPSTNSYPYNSIVTVTATPDGDHDFAGWTLTINGVEIPSGVNPIQVCITGNYSIRAHFALKQTYHSITVSGYNLSICSEVNPEVSIDGIPRGTAPLTVTGLTANQNHMIAVSVPQDPYPNTEFSYMYYEGGILYTNPATVQLNGDYHVTAYYFIPF